MDHAMAAARKHPHGLTEIDYKCGLGASNRSPLAQKAGENLRLPHQILLLGYNQASTHFVEHHGAGDQNRQSRQIRGQNQPRDPGPKQAPGAPPDFSIIFFASCHKESLPP